MNVKAFLVRVEAWCSNAVERAFALAFPLPLEPVRIARKLIAAFESTIPRDGKVISRIVVETSVYDLERLAPDYAALERQWEEMIAQLAVRSGRKDRPIIRLEATRSLPRGSVGVNVEVSDGVP
jgi:hypothetical protein